MEKLEENIFYLHKQLIAKKYKHGNYKTFRLSDPKPRIINKALVLDRILHHAVVRLLEVFYEKYFIYDSFSSRKGKGLHKGVNRLQKMLLSSSVNNSKKVYYLKCDINKFFDSVDHNILISILKKRIKDLEIINLLKNIIFSFSSSNQSKKGIPLGNYTSQLFSNIYMNEFDQYIKRILKVKYYIRYSDDFIILNDSKENLFKILNKIKLFLEKDLKLKLHKRKISINDASKGLDFLGYIIFPYHKILRTKTKIRIIKKNRKNPNKNSLNSYLGITKHANANNIRRLLNKDFHNSN